MMANPFASPEQKADDEIAERRRCTRLRRAHPPREKSRQFSCRSRCRSAAADSPEISAVQNARISVDGFPFVRSFIRPVSPFSLPACAGFCDTAGGASPPTPPRPSLPHDIRHRVRDILRQKIALRLLPTVKSALRYNSVFVISGDTTATRTPYFRASSKRLREKLASPAFYRAVGTGRADSTAAPSRMRY